MELWVITKKRQLESIHGGRWHGLSEQCVWGHYRTQSVRAENFNFILKAIGSHKRFVDREDSWSKQDFREIFPAAG